LDSLRDECFDPRTAAATNTVPGVEVFEDSAILAALKNERVRLDPPRNPPVDDVEQRRLRPGLEDGGAVLSGKESGRTQLRNGEGREEIYKFVREAGDSVRRTRSASGAA
jgi:hypothetical protein